MLSDGRSREWVKRLPPVIGAINIGTKKVKPGELKVHSSNVQYKRSVSLSEKRLPPDVNVKHLNQVNFKVGIDVEQQILSGVLRFMIYLEALLHMINLFCIIY